MKRKLVGLVGGGMLAAAAEIVCPQTPDADETIHFDGADEFFN